MNRLDELKHIVATQKTITTSRLEPILKEIELMYIQQGNTIRRQKKQMEKLNGKYVKLLKEATIRIDVSH